MSRREIAVSVGVAIALTVGWLAVLPHVRHTGGDTLDYLRMAADPKATGHTPFAFRGLTPWLAHALGGPHHYSEAFRLITGSALASAGPAVYLICRRLGGEHRAALVGMAGLMSLPLWLFNLYQPYLIDGPAMALTAWSMTAVVYGWMAVLPLLLVATGLARETVAALALPIYMWLRTRWVDLHTAVRVLLVVSPALLTTWAIRQPMQTRGWSSTTKLLEVGWQIMWRDRIATNPPWWIFDAFAGSLGIWWVLGFYGWRYGGRLWWLLVPVFAQFTVGADWSRFALYAFPVVVPAAAIAIWRHPRRTVLLALVAVQSLMAFVDLGVKGVLAINGGQPSTWACIPLAVLTALTLWWPRPSSPRQSWRRRSNRDTAPGEAGVQTDPPTVPPAYPTRSKTEANVASSVSSSRSTRRSRTDTRWRGALSRSLANPSSVSTASLPRRSSGQLSRWTSPRFSIEAT